MHKRTNKEIADQIQGLINEKESLPEFSFFGDKNWDKIDAQISVLKGEHKPNYYYEDESAEEFQDGDNDIFFAAEEANDWLNGSKTENLYSGE